MRRILALFLLGTTAIFVATAIWFSMLQEFIPVFTSCLIAWNSYILSHYLVSREFVHSRTEEIEIDLPHRTERKLESGIGVVMMITSFPIGILGVNQYSFLTLLFSVTIFICGYSLLHRGMTGELL